MYARYKKEGPAILKQYKAGQVSKQDFEKWINSTRLKQEKRQMNNSTNFFICLLTPFLSILV